MKHWLIKYILHVLKLARKCIDDRFLRQFNFSTRQSNLLHLPALSTAMQDIFYDHGSTFLNSKCTWI